MQTLDAGGARFLLVGVVDGVPMIHDLDYPGTCSVTNAAESVVPAVLEEISITDGMRPEVIIYRDSMGQFDGLLFDRLGQFAGYLPLGGARHASQALEALRRMDRNE